MKVLEKGKKYYGYVEGRGHFSFAVERVNKTSYGIRINSSEYSLYGDYTLWIRGNDLVLKINCVNSRVEILTTEQFRIHNVERQIRAARIKIDQTEQRKAKVELSMEYYKKCMESAIEKKDGIQQDIDVQREQVAELEEKVREMKNNLKNS
ncbi:MAG: hypothetical protein ACRDDH_11840 [Cetobacterium sp.]|uniref:hypothetical protein n=1 Tax=Cetobacterium sp. TaxID=2071632 RepID=UPI003EE7F16D